VTETRDDREARREQVRRSHEYVDGLQLLPEHMQAPILRWIEDGGPIGDFLTALLSNNLMEAFGRADDQNTAAMRNWVQFLYNHAPHDCYGSPDIVKAWRTRGGLLGPRAEPQHG
jgi:hypothetical protein